MGAELPTQVGRYDIRGTVGGGGMGDVYRAYDPASRREVALKILKFTYPRALHYFKREFRAVARLRHPNLVGLYDLHQDGESYFYTMELIDGVDLYMYVNRNNHVLSDPAKLCAPERLDRVRSTLIQLLRALAFLHDNKCIHRDIKPSNVLVDTTGRLKLVDFGIVKELLPGGEGQSLSQVFGTSTYFSPEQSLGSRVTSATDLYAVGVVLYELLSGSPPFEGESSEIALKHRTEPPPSLVQKVPGVPPDLALVCMELLSKEPADRPSAREALEVLKAELEEAPPDEEIDFVGRRDARRTLHTALEQVRQGVGQLVLLEGANGTGKSSVIQALGDEARLYGASMFTGACVHGDHVEMRGLDTLVERLAEAYRKQTARLIRHLPANERGPLLQAFTFLGELLPAKLHGTVGRLGADLGLHAVITGLGEKRLLILVLEQVHLGDDALLDMLEALQRGGHLPPVLMIFTLRPEAVPKHGRLPDYLEFVRSAPTTHTVQLGPFTLDEIQQMIDDHVEDAAEGLAEHVLAEADGIPLFVTRLVAEAAREGQGSLPTLKGEVSKRVQDLSDSAASVLRAVSVCRAAVRSAVLERACGLDGDGLYDALSALSAAGLVQFESDSEGEVRAVPRHARLIKVVREMLDPDALLRQHESLARAYELTGGLPRDVDYHWTQAGRAERGLEFALRTAPKAREKGDHAYASELLDYAVQNTADAAERTDLRVQLAESLALSGRFQRAAEQLSALIDDDPREAKRWRARRCQLYLMAGDLASFLSNAHDLPVVAAVPLADLLAPLLPQQANAMLGTADGTRAGLVRARLFADLDDPAALTAAEERVDIELSSDDPSLRAAHAYARAAVLEAKGAHAAAHAVVDEAITNYAKLLPEHDLSGLRLRLARTRACLIRGLIKEARRLGRGLLAEARERGLNGFGAQVALVHARTLIEAGEHDAAEPMLARAGGIWPEDPPSMPQVELALTQVRRLFYMGKLEQALSGLQAVQNHAPYEALLSRRRPSRCAAALEARIRLTQAIRLWRAEKSDPKTINAVLRPAWAKLDEAQYSEPSRDLFGGINELVTWQPERALARLDERLSSPLDWPDHRGMLATFLTAMGVTLMVLDKDGEEELPPSDRRAPRVRGRAAPRGQGAAG